MALRATQPFMSPPLFTGFTLGSAFHTTFLCHLPLFADFTHLTSLSIQPFFATFLGRWFHPLDFAVHTTFLCHLPWSLISPTWLRFPYNLSLPPSFVRWFHPLDFAFHTTFLCHLPWSLISPTWLRFPYNLSLPPSLVADFTHLTSLSIQPFFATFLGRWFHPLDFAFHTTFLYHLPWSLISPTWLRFPYNLSLPPSLVADFTHLTSLSVQPFFTTFLGRWFHPLDFAFHTTFLCHLPWSLISPTWLRFPHNLSLPPSLVADFTHLTSLSTQPFFTTFLGRWFHPLDFAFHTTFLCHLPWLLISPTWLRFPYNLSLPPSLVADFTHLTSLSIQPFFATFFGCWFHPLDFAFHTTFLYHLLWLLISPTWLRFPYNLSLPPSLVADFTHLTSLSIQPFFTTFFGCWFHPLDFAFHTTFLCHLPWLLISPTWLRFPHNLSLPPSLVADFTHLTSLSTQPFFATFLGRWFHPLDFAFRFPHNLSLPPSLVADFTHLASLSIQPFCHHPCSLASPLVPFSTQPFFATFLGPWLRPLGFLSIQLFFDTVFDRWLHLPGSAFHTCMLYCNWVINSKHGDNWALLLSVVENQVYIYMI